MRKNILYVTDSLPTPGFGSSVIIYRHLKLLKNWNISIVTYQQQVKNKYNIPRSWHIIDIPRNYPCRWLELFYSKLLKSRLELSRQICESKLCNNKPNIILNVFGKNSILAYYLSEVWNIPLFIILHDRWEVWVKFGIEYIHMKKLAKKNLKHAFKIWSVSPELLDYYGLENNNNARILYPIPENSSKNFVDWKFNFKTRPIVAFAGSFQKFQINHFRVIAQALKKVNGKLLLITNQNNRVKSKLGYCSNIIYKKPFGQNNKLINFLKKKASCIFVPFYTDLDRWNLNRISFPSKLVEFAHLGLPIIIISSPDTSLSKWARKYKWGSYLSKLDYNLVLDMIEKLRNQKKWTEMAKQSQKIALAEFNRNKIQKQFENELNNVLNRNCQRQT